MARNVRIEDMDLGWERIAGDLLTMDGAHVDVGIFPEAGQHPSGGGTVAQVAAHNEYGTKNIPSRPFLRDTYQRNEARYAREAQMVFGAVVNGAMNPDAALQTLGAIQAGDVKKTINEWTDPPNAPSTVAKKGKNDPLVDTRTMRDSVAFKKKLGRGR